jgi:hypothetical protein
MLRRVALVRTGVSEDPDEGGASSFETSVLIRATRRNIPEDTFLHSHRRENLKSYITNIRQRSDLIKSLHEPRHIVVTYFGVRVLF